MARYKPDSSKAMLEINGVGSIKMERFGYAFLNIIKEHLQNQNKGNDYELSRN